jgi:hypothetical protein
MTIQEESRHHDNPQVTSWRTDEWGGTGCRVFGPALRHSLWVRESFGQVLVDDPDGSSNHSFDDLDGAIDWALTQAGTPRPAIDRFPEATKEDLDEVQRAMHLGGEPGLVWYSRVHKVYGSELRLGDWLDTLDHHGARMIYGIWYGINKEASAVHCTADRSGFRTVMFSAGDTEVVSAYVQYDVVDPNSQVRPDRVAEAGLPAA